MSQAYFGTRGAVAPGSSLCRRSAPLVAALAVALLSGCANRDSITVGSVPDDYRTNHPIVIAEKQEVIDIPVGTGDRGVTASQRASLEGFLGAYDRGASPVVSILVPAGSANEIAAAHVGRDFIGVAKKNGVPASRIALASYQTQSAEVSAPIRVTYTTMRAQTDKCGRWPDDLLENTENKHYANFGCSYQNNLAAQIANPSDLLGPRKRGDIDAARRDAAIDNWRGTEPDEFGEVTY